MYVRTPACLIQDHGRLFFLKKKSTLCALIRHYSIIMIRPCAFINFLIYSTLCAYQALFVYQANQSRSKYITYSSQFKSSQKPYFTTRVTVQFLKMLSSKFTNKIKRRKLLKLTIYPSGTPTLKYIVSNISLHMYLVLLGA